MLKRKPVPDDVRTRLAAEGFKPSTSLGWGLGTSVVLPCEGDLLVRWGVSEVPVPEVLEFRGGFEVYRDPGILGTLSEYFAEAGENVTALLNLTDSCMQALMKLHPTVHGGLHPDNVFLTTGGDLFLVGRGPSDLPPGYRCRIEGVPTVQDDLYAWGVCMRVLLKGHPWAHHSTEEVTEMVTRGGRVKMETVPQSVKKHRQELLAFIEGLLNDRFDSAETARAALLKFHKPRLKAELSALLASERIQVKGILGQGGMGAVYWGMSGTERVALKVMLEVPADSREAMATRFEAEARTLKRLTHAGVVGFRNLLSYEVEDEESGETHDRQAMVLEYVPGVPLDLWFELTGRTLSRLGAVVEQLLETLAYLHAQNLVHRDLKPDNILVGPGDRVKLLDFGVVKDPKRQLTAAGEGLGTPAFWAPEQLTDNDKVDGRTDLYTLGLVLIKLFCGSGSFVYDAQMQTGETMFLGGSLFEGRERGQVVSGPVPAMLVAFLQKLVVREMAARYESAAVALEVWRRLVAAGALSDGVGTPRVGAYDRTPALRQGWQDPSGRPPSVGVLYGAPGTGKTRLLKEHAGWVLAECLGEVRWLESLEGVTVQALEQAAAGLSASLLVPMPRLLVCLDNNGGAGNEATLDFLNAVAALKSPRLVAVATARARSMPFDSRQMQVPVQPLTPFECTEMARAALAAREVSAAMSTALFEFTAGVPRLVELVLGAMEENGHYVRFPDRQAVGLKPFSALPLPAGARGLLRAMLEDEPDEVVRMLAGLGVLGEEVDKTAYRLWGMHCGHGEKSLFTSTGRPTVVKDSAVLALSADRSAYGFVPRMLAPVVAELCSKADAEAAHELGLGLVEQRMDRLLNNVHDHCREVVGLCRERVRHLRALGRSAEAVQWSVEGADLASFLGDWTQAEAWLRAALEELGEGTPERARALALAATIATAVGKRREAKRLAEEALAVAEVLDQPAVWCEVLSLVPIVYIETQQLDLALQLLNKGTALMGLMTTPQKSRYQIRIGFLYLMGTTGVSHEEALDALTTALGASDSAEVPRETRSNAFNNRGRVHLRDNQVNEAESDFRQAAEDPYARRGERSWAYNNLGLVCWKQRLDGQAAIQAYRQAIVQAHNDSTPEKLWPIYNNIGYLQGQLGERLESAIASFESAEISLPGTASPAARAGISLARAETFMQYGEHDGAEDGFRQVLELVGEDIPDLSLYSLRGLVLLGKPPKDSIPQIMALGDRSVSSDHLWAARWTSLYASLDQDNATDFRDLLAGLSEVYPRTSLRGKEGRPGPRDAEWWEAQAYVLMLRGEVSAFEAHLAGFPAFAKGLAFPGGVPEMVRRVARAAVQRGGSWSESPGLLEALRVATTRANLSGAKKEKTLLDKLMSSLPV
ncbi:MAG TPA: serine/threonine-protein kinase [Candidatus Xenobia bacterium]|jgi:tetratricopeptide (TPR) repeat protein/predicted Ser/Thr protein kinase